MNRGNNILSFDEAYSLTLNILNECYVSYKENDSLASLLSDMDTQIFRDGKPADPATYEDWLTIVKSFSKNESIDFDNLMLALVEFLEYYQNEFGYDLDNIIEYFKNCSNSE